MGHRCHAFTWPLKVTRHEHGHTDMCALIHTFPDMCGHWHTHMHTHTHKHTHEHTQPRVKPLPSPAHSSVTEQSVHVRTKATDLRRARKADGGLRSCSRMAVRSDPTWLTWVPRVAHWASRGWHLVECPWMGTELGFAQPPSLDQAQPCMALSC